MTLQRKSHKLIGHRALLAPLPSDAPAAVVPSGNDPAGGGQNNGNGNGNATPPGPGGGNGNAGPPGSGIGGGNGPPQVTAQPSNNPPTRPSPPPPQTPTPSSTPVATTPATSTTLSTPTSTSTSTSTPSTTSSSSASTSISSTSSDSQTSTSTHTFILTAPTLTNTLAPSLVPISASSSRSATPSASPSASSGVKVGSVVGGIAGGIVGIAVLGILISFILRRLRKRNRRDTIIGDDYRRSEFLGSNTPINDPLPPPSMAQFSRDSTSSPGMAGQGAYRGGNAVYSDNAPAQYAVGRHTVPDWGATAGVGAAGAAASRQEYGRRSPEEVDDISHGVYSSQPQQQMAYNPEAYGSYAAYGQDHHAATGGYQEATREYQGQKAYNAGGYNAQEFGGGASYGVAVADHNQSSSATGAHPSTLQPALRNQSNVTSNRQENARSVVQDDDVYGGI